MGNWRLEKVALYFTFSVVLGAGGVDYSTWQFWLSMMVMLVIEAVAVRTGREEGAAAVFDLSRAEILKIKDLIDGAQ
jgi:hypothetical protein